MTVSLNLSILWKELLRIRKLLTGYLFKQVIGLWKTSMSLFHVVILTNSLYKTDKKFKILVF